MSKLNEVVEFLREKVRKVNVNNPKANTGGVLLKFHKTWEEDLPHMVSTVFQIMQQHFTTTTTQCPAGVSQLTATSTAIGVAICRLVEREPSPWSFHVRTGDLFIEAFKACGLIDLYYPQRRDSSYIITATHEWTKLADIPDMVKRITLQGTSTTPIPEVDGPFQEYNGNKFEVVKGSSYPIDLSLPWVKAINNLQETGWRINKDVFSVVKDCEDLFISHDEIPDNEAKEQKRRSKLVEWSFIIAKAEMLEKEDVFYQYMDTDYRGRIYCKEPFLNFQGPDLARGIMEFAIGKPMTEEGMQWLAIHTASSCNMSYTIDEIPEWCSSDYKAMLEEEGLEDISVDKMTLEDRITWVNEHMDTILSYGKDKSVYANAEKPVSFYACCLEWYNISLAQKDNRIYFSHLPIPIDGSNNGWQHLGAISKDTLTGELVGLVPVEIQKDFYVQTAKELISSNENTRLQGILETMPMKHIRKGISKRGSMTRAYSAGANKIAQNMYYDCEGEDFHIKYDITQDDCSKLAKQLVKAIDVVCPGPLETMGYLQNLAAYEIGKYEPFGPDGEKGGARWKAIGKRRAQLYKKKDKTDEELEELSDLTNEAENYTYKRVYGNGKDYLTWITPSGFFVKYTNWVMNDLKTIGTIGGKYVKHVAKVPSKKPDMKGFMSGVSPNFIHSMDASHMALVIAQWGGDFGAVHDSFSTHASDVPHLLALTKRVFIDMYDTDNFYNYIEEQLISDRTNLDVEQPALGTLDINGVEESDFFFA